MTPRAETRETRRCGVQDGYTSDGYTYCDEPRPCPIHSPAPASGGETTLANLRAEIEEAVRDDAMSGGTAKRLLALVDSLAASPASGGPSVAEQFAALGWDFASVEDAAAELERLSGMVRANVASRIAAENERDDAVRGHRWSASGGPGVGREEDEWRRFMVECHAQTAELRGFTDAQKAAVRFTLETLIAAWDKGRSPAGPPRETGSEDSAILDAIEDDPYLTYHVRPGRNRIGVPTGGWLWSRGIGERFSEESVLTFRDAIKAVLASKGRRLSSSRAPGAASRDTTTSED